MVSLNLKRRNLTKSQAVACAVEMLPVFEAEALERKRVAGGQHHRGKRKVPDLGPGPSKENEAREQVAAQFGVSGRHVQRAKKLKQTAPQQGVHAERTGIDRRSDSRADRQAAGAVHL